MHHVDRDCGKARRDAGPHHMQRPALDTVTAVHPGHPGHRGLRRPGAPGPHRLARAHFQAAILDEVDEILFQAVVFCDSFSRVCTFCWCLNRTPVCAALALSAVPSVLKFEVDWPSVPIVAQPLVTSVSVQPGLAC